MGDCRRINDMFTLKIRTVGHVFNVTTIFVATLFLLAIMSCSDKHKAEKCAKEFIQAYQSNNAHARDSIFVTSRYEPTVRYKKLSSTAIGNIYEDSLSSIYFDDYSKGGVKISKLFVVPVGKSELFVAKFEDKSFRIVDTRNLFTHKASDSKAAVLARKVGIKVDVPQKCNTDMAAFFKSNESENAAIDIASSSDFTKFLFEKYPQVRTLGPKVLKFSKANYTGDTTFFTLTMQGGTKYSKISVNVYGRDSHGNIVARKGDSVNLAPNQVCNVIQYHFDDPTHIIKTINYEWNEDLSVEEKLLKYARFTGNEYQEYLKSLKK